MDEFPQDWDFTLWLKVTNPEQLRQAALAHEDCDPDDDLMDLDGGVDINACLVILLDNPVPGCEITSSGAHPA